MSVRHPHVMKKPRNHEGLAWEEETLSNEFIDINRMALDDAYAKNAAPLSKRRNGIGFTDGNTNGLFGLSGLGHRVPMRESGVNYTDEEIDTWVRNNQFLTQNDIRHYVREQGDPLREEDRRLNNMILDRESNMQYWMSRLDDNDRAFSQRYTDGRTTNLEQYSDDTALIVGVGLSLLIGLGFYAHSKKYHSYS
tara:strand:- start:41 stop:622 length:582 start_codon:yes stop_codon:yes gene_type:complete